MDQKNLVKFPDHVPPTLESLPPEVQLQICREMLRSVKPITLSPREPYVSGFAFGSLGLLRVSKYFSTMALSVMYGENCFRLISLNRMIEDDDLEDDDLEDDGLEEDDLEEDDLEDDDLENDDLEDDDQDTVHIETLRHSPWKNLRSRPHELFGNVVSSVDLLNLISQTSPGQTFLKHLRIDFDTVEWVRVTDGVLFLILKRMRGLQSVDLDLLSDWGGIIPYHTVIEQKEWQERNAQDFLLLIKEKLSHIKKITMSWNVLPVVNDPAIIYWMADELEKRNEAWAPPLPSYKKFRRTFSPMSVMDAEVARSVVQVDDMLRFKDPKHSRARLEGLYGVSIDKKRKRVLAHGGQLTPGKVEEWKALIHNYDRLSQPNGAK